MRGASKIKNQAVNQPVQFFHLGSRGGGGWFRAIRELLFGRSELDLCALTSLNRVLDACLSAVDVRISCSEAIRFALVRQHSLILLRIGFKNVLHPNATVYGQTDDGYVSPEQTFAGLGGYKGRINHNRLNSHLPSDNVLVGLRHRCHVLQNKPFGVAEAEDTHVFPEQTRPLAFQPFAVLLGNAEILARASAYQEVNVRDIPYVPYVAETDRVSVLIADLNGVFINFTGVVVHVEPLTFQTNPRTRDAVEE